jgi:hypothetical protein
MAINNNINYCSTPKDLFEFVEEQLFQNAKNVETGKRKLSTCILGAPGIGKTSVLEQFPILRLEKINSQIISTYLENFIVKYNTFETIEVQNERILSMISISNKEKEELTKKLLTKPETKIVMVSQADIIVAEDISGLPSSDSEYSSLGKLYNLALVYHDSKNNNESKELIDFFLKRIGTVLKQNSVGNVSFENDEIKNTVDRNVTKFDFTEWEKKVHDIHLNEPDIKHIILVLDDITRAAAHNTAILNVLMPVFQQYTVGQRPLPSNCSVVITSNEEESENGQFNYVGKLDEAQTDRLFTTKVIFNMEDWQDHARNNHVHESVILFAQHQPKLFDPKNNSITPRRLTQLGQALYNKFGTSAEIFNKNVESNKELVKTLKMQLGDPNNANYAQVITSFIGFLKNTGGDAMKFIEELKQGFSPKLQQRLETFKNSGETVKINIIIHKILDIINYVKIDATFKKAIIDLFTIKGLIPENLLFTFKRLQTEIIERVYNFTQGKDKSALNKNLIEQTRDIIKKVVPELEQILKEMQYNAKKVQEENK